ncbi:MAG: gfo/Idh/MocA family oxidoreductase, partial [Candidatus Aminicenantes bacterium]
TGFEMFTAEGEGRGGYVAEKAEGQTGWLFPVGDEVHELGYAHMFQDMLDAWEAGREPMETFYDGYVVNAIIDTCYKSMKSGRWEAVKIEGWPGREFPGNSSPGKPIKKAQKRGFAVIKTEQLPDGRTKVILKDRATGRIIERMQ